jgi:hypothetical protein
VDVGPSEDRAFWTAFLRGLVKRGLRGVRLVVSDAHEGLKQAISTVPARCDEQAGCRQFIPAEPAPDLQGLRAAFPGPAESWRRPAAEEHTGRRAQVGRPDQRAHARSCVWSPNANATDTKWGLSTAAAPGLGSAEVR